MIQIKTTFEGHRIMLDTDDSESGQRFAEHIIMLMDCKYPGLPQFTAEATLVEDDDAMYSGRLDEETELSGHDEDSGDTRLIQLGATDL